MAMVDLDLTPYFADADVTDTVTLLIAPADLPFGLTFDPATGVISGTPSSDASQSGPNSDGIYPITVTATDGNGSTFTTNVTYTIANPAPVANNDAIGGTEDNPVTGSLFDPNGTPIGDTDPDGDRITVSRVITGNDVADLAPLTDGTGVATGVTGSNGGTFTVQPDGAYTFVPGTAFDDLAVGESRTTEVVTRSPTARAAPITPPSPSPSPASTMRRSRLTPTSRRSTR